MPYPPFYLHLINVSISILDLTSIPKSDTLHINLLIIVVVVGGGVNC